MLVRTVTPIRIGFTTFRCAAASAAARAAPFIIALPPDV
jgi:cobalamin biosynthesis protein CbiD